MKIGIYGGTFNPVHNGHLINALYIREEFLLDKIIFIPLKSPVHKEIDCFVSPDDRFSMVSLAVDGCDGLESSRIEIDRSTPSYTVYTLGELAGIYPGAEFFLIMGSDSFEEFHLWKDYRLILERANLIIMKRTGDAPVNTEVPSEKVHLAGNPVIEISSSDIRKRIKKDLDIRYQLPDQVIRFIRQKGLYKN